MEEGADSDGPSVGYDHFADEYAEHAATSIYNALYDRPTVLQLLGDVDGLEVLDAGCGPGLYAEELTRRGARVTAIDTSPRMVALARARLADDAVVRRHDLTEPLHWADDGAFDVVLVALVVHHLEDRSDLLEEAHRVLRDRGRLVVSTHHPMNDWLRLGGSYFDIGRVDEVWKGSWHVTYWRQPLQATCDEFADAGFVIERIVEPQPTTAIRERDPDEFAELAERPAFIAFRLAKRS
jgi:2-polyprenyl-3-methyl-5-hydroxy-6-metoxy-1,4-benzoquinol methylase